MNDDLYPPSIKGAPPELTTPNAQYRRQVVIVLVSLVVFVLFYFGLIFGSLYVVSAAVDHLNMPEAYRRQSGKDWLGVAGLISFVLFLFLVKGLFKWRRQKNELQIEITEKEHPNLFRFIRHICDETKAPFPYRVFLTPEVNAAVFYNHSLLNLIVPVRKNLLIGLGLVNGLNLSEFKAVLAHEFGHFSQSSMRLGSYVYIANRIIYDIVYQRDFLDDLLAKAKRIDLRIAVFAYLIYGVLWVLRKLLQGAFRLINFVERALSRQMEFHADLVAVSITGSDSLIHALHKLEFTNTCLMQAFGDLKDASEHKLYTQDIYYHQTMAAEHLRRTLNKPELGTIPALPDNPTEKIAIFTHEDDEEDSEGMWASHPSHYAREQNAKQHYLRSIEDDRSPWLLFSNPEGLRRRMTERFYSQVLELPANTRFASPEEVQSFIDQEHAETNQDARYLGMYDGRLLQITLETLPTYANDPAVPQMSEPQIRALLRRLYNAEYKDWQEANQKRHQEHDLLEGLESGELKLKAKTFEFRGKQVGMSDVAALKRTVDAELETDTEWLRQFDREVFQTHLRMAQLLAEGDQELYLRYYFHVRLQDTAKAALQEEARLGAMFGFLSSKQEGLSQQEFDEIIEGFRQSHQNIEKALTEARSQPIPALQNMQEGIPLSAHLLEEPLVAFSPVSGKSRLDGKWAASFAQQVSQIEGRCRRLYFKSMGSILARQESIAEAWQERYGREITRDAPEPAVVTSNSTATLLEQELSEKR